MVIEKSKYMHFHSAKARGRILMVLSSPAISQQTGWPIGFWASELTHPLLHFQDAGYEVVLASTEGGKVEMDGYSNPTDPNGYAASDIISLGYLQREWFSEKINSTIPVAEVDPSAYDAIYLVGGQGPMYTFYHNVHLQQLFVAFYESGKPAAAVCHATCILLQAKTSDGQLLVQGKTWTGFANSEEDFAEQATGIQIQPFRIENEAGKIQDTKFKVGSAFSSFVIADGNLITGQQQNSGAAAAELVIEQLNKK